MSLILVLQSWFYGNIVALREKYRDFSTTAAKSPPSGEMTAVIRAIQKSARRKGQLLVASGCIASCVCLVDGSMGFRESFANR